jgi:hypothetical protein
MWIVWGCTLHKPWTTVLRRANTSDTFRVTSEPYLVLVILMSHCTRPSNKARWCRAFGCSHSTSRMALPFFMKMQQSVRHLQPAKQSFSHLKHWKIPLYVVSYQVITATSMEMTVFWDVAPCSLEEIDRRFRGASSYHFVLSSHRLLKTWGKMTGLFIVIHKCSI